MIELGKKHVLRPQRLVAHRCEGPVIVLHQTAIIFHFFQRRAYGLAVRGARQVDGTRQDMSEIVGVRNAHRGIDVARVLDAELALEPGQHFPGDGVIGADETIGLHHG